ncbi:MAG: hypothetical protein ACI4IE_07655 [Eubacterium sp.]
MKKSLCLIIGILFIISSFAGCSQSKEKEDTTAQQTTQQSADVDLTALSGTMVYSEVYNMVTTPEDYIGKTVKMNGQYNIWSNEEQTQQYYAVVISDATACCQQGLEFELPDKSAPPCASGDEITVIGTFNTYQEGEYTYCHLENAQII